MNVVHHWAASNKALPTQVQTHQGWSWWTCYRTSRSAQSERGCRGCRCHQRGCSPASICGIANRSPERLPVRPLASRERARRAPLRWGPGRRTRPREPQDPDRRGAAEGGDVDADGELVAGEAKHHQVSRTGERGVRAGKLVEGDGPHRPK